MSSEEREVKRLRIRGTVHGVGYRVWVEREALALGLKGWVRNRRDGAVGNPHPQPGPGGSVVDRAQHRHRFTGSPVQGRLHHRVAAGQLPGHVAVARFAAEAMDADLLEAALGRARAILIFTGNCSTRRRAGAAGIRA